MLKIEFDRYGTIFPLALLVYSNFLYNLFHLAVIKISINYRSCVKIRYGFTVTGDGWSVLFSVRKKIVLSFPRLQKELHLSR